MNEFELIDALAPFLAGAGNGVLIGHGDDAAVLEVGGERLCLTVDVVVEGVHFRRDLSTLADVGWKAIAVNVSDVGAMGAYPTVALVGLSRPESMPLGEVRQLYGGMQEACEAYGVRLVGGDTVAAPALSVSVTMLGALPAGAVSRSGARPGDRLVLVGSLGAGAAALAMVEAHRNPLTGLLAAHRRPRALPAAGVLLAAEGATAMIDVSDGLGADLGHICESSGVRARVDAYALPVAAGVDVAIAAAQADRWQIICGGGEDFALLAALPPDIAETAAAKAAAAEGVPAAVVGDVLPPGPAAGGADPGHDAVDASGGGTAAVLVVGDEERDLTALGYEHFRAPRRERVEAPQARCGGR